MQNLNAIDLDDGFQAMMIVWDLGRRCNYDCTYCTTYMHNNWSPHATLDELKRTMRFIDEYFSLYEQFQNYPNKPTITFTGGEPTVNPNFMDLCEWITAEYPKYRLSLTTNGTWPQKKGDDIKRLFNAVTVSYHTEADPSLKQRSIENILYLQEIGARVKVNVMMHQQEDYFNECIHLMENILEPNGVKFIPRIIGEGYEEKEWVDKDKKRDTVRKKVHSYDPAQMAYMKQYWDRQNSSVAIKPIQIVRNVEDLQKSTSVEGKVVGRSMGRGCCGGRTMCGKKEGEWSKFKFAESTNFKDWYCMVNWFFLHIEQEKDLVYHHQTCRTSLNSVEEPIGTLSNYEAILDGLEQKMFVDRKLEMIKCPHSLCGCGMCAPKADNAEDAQKIFAKYTKNLTPLL